MKKISPLAIAAIFRFRNQTPPRRLTNKVMLETLNVMAIIIAGLMWGMNWPLPRLFTQSGSTAGCGSCARGQCPGACSGESHAILVCPGNLTDFGWGPDAMAPIGRMPVCMAVSTGLWCWRLSIRSRRWCRSTAELPLGKRSPRRPIGRPSGENGTGYTAGGFSSSRRRSRF